MLPKKIFIVDDEASITKLLSTLLSFQTNDKKEKLYDVKVFDGGNPCLAALQAGASPDLVISDVRMPNGEGTVILDFINKNSMNIPLFFMTGFSGNMNVDDLINQGAKKVFPKPFKSAHLLSEINSILK